MTAVAITGVGTIGSYGCGLPRLAEALLAGTPKMSEVERSAGYHLTEGARLAARITMEDLARWVTPSAARRMSPPSRLAVAAARMALEDAGLAEEDARVSTAIILATSFGASSFTEKLFRLILAEGPESASPFLFMESVANAPAGQAAIHCAATGLNATIVQGETDVCYRMAADARQVGTAQYFCGSRPLRGSGEGLRWDAGTRAPVRPPPQWLPALGGSDSSGARAGNHSRGARRAGLRSRCRFRRRL